ncbi:hypothetical protein ABZP36_003411 [Zizania latifolia]
MRRRLAASSGCATPTNTPGPCATCVGARVPPAPALVSACAACRVAVHPAAAATTTAAATITTATSYAGDACPPLKPRTIGAAKHGNGHNRYRRRED